jgi:hypothetical protein
MVLCSLQSGCAHLRKREGWHLTLVTPTVLSATVASIDCRSDSIKDFISFGAGLYWFFLSLSLLLTTVIHVKLNKNIKLADWEAPETSGGSDM